MIVNVIEIFTEYVSILLCMHKMAGKKMLIDRYVIIFSLLNVASVLTAYKYQEECRYLALIMYINLIVYAKIRLAEKWTKAIKIFGLMFILIPCLQLIVFYFVKVIFIFFNISQSRYVVGIVINSLICLIIAFWKRQYVSVLAEWLEKTKGMIIVFSYILIAGYLLFFYKKTDCSYEPMTLQSVLVIIVVGIISILWINAENEKRVKEKALQLYETYNRTFEEAISAIRVRQHEFDNHITAIKCLQYTIDNPKDLIKAQNEYCDMILRENSFNSLLKLHTEPILTGFLYFKFMNAREKGIDIFHIVHSIGFHNREEITELIEIIGILFDNAVEALLDSGYIEKKIIVKVLQEDGGKIIVEVANKSKKYLNSEMEKFCINGYSTKEKMRGVGLTRVKEIIKVHKADFSIENVNYNGDNFLSFKIKL